jgi:hypothetical protein
LFPDKSSWRIALRCHRRSLDAHFELYGPCEERVHIGCLFIKT